MSLTDVPGKAPTRKVTAGALGAGAGTVVADFVLWALSELLLDGGEVPAEPRALINFFVPLLLAGAAGYFTPRGAEEIAPPRVKGDHAAY